MIYLDNASTTKIDPEVLDAMMPYLTDEYGNPSGKYNLGYRAKDAIENARKSIATTLGVKSDEIYFTSGSTEAINYIYRSKEFQKIATGSVEHHAILNQPLCRTYIGLDKKGIYNLKDLDHVYTDREIVTLFLQYANNEIGSIHPIKEFGEFCHDNNIIFVTDATQAYSHIEINCKEDNIDILIASGHKFGAPKGVGFIYVKDETMRLLNPMQYGGQQEKYFRSGTENVAGIVGLGKAAEIAYRDLKENTRYINGLRNQLYGWITNNITGASINGTADWRKRLPGHLSFTFNHVRGEELAAYLNEWGIYVSTGSACNSNSNRPSEVLLELGLTEEEANNSIRFSIGKDVTKKDIEYVCGTLENGIKALRY